MMITNRIGDFVVLSLFAFAAGSNVGITLFSTNAGYIPEIVIIPLVLILTVSNGSLGRPLKYVVNNSWIYVVAIMLFVLTLIGIVNTGVVGPCVADARNIMYAVLFYAYLNGFCKYDREVCYKALVVFLVLCCIFDLMDYMLYNEARVGLDDAAADVNRNRFNIVNGVALLVLSIRLKRSVLAVVALVIIGCMAILGNFRQYYIVAAIALMMWLVSHVTLRRGAGMGLKFAAVALFIVLIWAGFGARTIIQDYFASNNSANVNIIRRTTNLVDNITSLDGIRSVEPERVNSIVVLFEKPERFMFPHGLGWRPMIGRIEGDFSDYSLLSSHDSAFFFIAYHAGLPSLLIVISTSIFIIGRSLWLCVDGLPVAVKWLAILLLAFLLFTEAGYFTVLPRALSLASFLILCFRQEETLRNPKVAVHIRQKNVKKYKGNDRW
jgi:hypothetical protein